MAPRRGCQAHLQLAKGRVTGPKPNRNFGPKAPSNNFGTKNGIRAQRGKRMLRPLIPAWLDELGLPASEHRVLCHLWRRADPQGWSYPSVASIAQVCRLNEDTVWRMLRSLRKRSLIVRLNVPGRTNHFRVVVPHPPETEGYHQPETEGLGAPETEGLHPPETEGSEGNPMKASHRAASYSTMAGGSIEAESTKARGAQKPGTGAPTSVPSRPSLEELGAKGCWDRDNTGQPDRPEPHKWQWSPKEFGGLDWSQLTPAEQCECWRRIDPADPAADYEGWPRHVAEGGV